MNNASYIGEELARKVLALLDHGLSHGMGDPEPGKMCVEAAVNYAMGAPHGDQPACVSPALRSLKIRLNDTAWSSNKARAEGLKRLAIVQLGSAGTLDEKEFAKRVSRLAIQMAVPQALRAAASLRRNGERKDRLLHWADVCEQLPTPENALEAKIAANAAYDANAAYAANAAGAAAAYAANAAGAAAFAADAAAYAANAANAAAGAYADARDKSLAAFCEACVQILIDMKVPGARYLYLTEAPR